MISKIALEAGRLAQSPQTKLVHLHYDKPFEERHDTIPLVENFLFALALLRTRMSENVLEAKGLLQHLLHFQNGEGNFPVYLHEFPKCREPFCGAKILPALYWIQKDFGHVLGSELSDNLKASAERIVRHCNSRETPPPPHIAILIEAYEGKPLSSPPTSPTAFACALIAAQMQGHPLDGLPWNSAFEFWHIGGESYEGPHEYDPRYQEGPYRLLYDFFMHTAYDTLPPISHPHPYALYAALIQPMEVQQKKEQKEFSVTQEGGSFRLMWTDGAERHVLTSKGKFHHHEHAISVGVDELSDDPLFAFELDATDHTKLLVNNEPATVFHQGDRVSVSTSSHRFSFAISLEGEGRVMGHISQKECIENTYRISKFSTNRKWVLFVRAVDVPASSVLNIQWNFEFLPK